MFILDENKHPKSYLINKAAQGWGGIAEQKGEVVGDAMNINESFDYGRHMAVIEDHINNRSVVYMTRYIPAETEEDCLGKTQVLAYEYTAELDAMPIETVITEIEGKDVYGEGELQLSADGTHLMYYNRTNNISGFAHKTVQVNLFELSGDKLSVVETKIVSRTLEDDPTKQHYGTYGEASAEFVDGNNLLFSQSGIFEENHADLLEQDGSEKQVYYYNTIDGSISFSSAAGENQFNEIRRGKNKLHYVANQEETAALHELSTFAELPFPVVALEIFPVDGVDDFTLISSLPSQPHKLVGDEEPTIYTRLVGAKQYEFNDHLGNVRAVTSDRRGFESITETETDVYEIANEAEIVAWTDYYPFGARQRGENTSEYRYGFQGQEMDDEIRGEGNSVNYKYRMHDPRVGRFFAVDPLTVSYPHYTPYSFSGNKVIAFVELEGLEEAPATNDNEYQEGDFVYSGGNCGPSAYYQYSCGTVNDDGTVNDSKWNLVTYNGYHMPSNYTSEHLNLIVASNQFSASEEQWGDFDAGLYVIGLGDIHSDKAEFIYQNREAIIAAAKYNGIPPLLLAAIAYNEYGGDPPSIDKIAMLLRDDEGDMRTSFGNLSVQLRRTAETLGYDPDMVFNSDNFQMNLADDLEDPVLGIFISAAHLADLKNDDFASVPALQMTNEQMIITAARYNRGPGSMLSIEQIQENMEYGEKFFNNEERVNKIFKLLYGVGGAGSSW